MNELRGRLKMAAAAGLSGEDSGVANFSRNGSPPVEIRPLNSLGELLAVAELAERSRYEAAVPVMEILPRLAVTDLTAVRRLIEEYAEMAPGRRPPPHAKAYAALLFRWAMLQPGEAAQYSFSHPDLLGELSDWNPMLLAFAAKQRPGTKDNLLAYVPREERADMEEFLTWRETTGGDPAAVLTDPEKVKHLKDYWAFQSMARQWLLRDPEAMLRWSGTVSADGRRDDVRKVIRDYFNGLGGGPSGHGGQTGFAAL